MRADREVLYETTIPCRMPCAGAAGGSGRLRRFKPRERPGARRIPERNLFLTAMAGGSIGAWLGMKVWHHKTLHKSFRFGIPIIFLCQVLLALGLFLYFRVIR